MNTLHLIESIIRPIRKHKIATLFAGALATGVIAAWGIRSQVGEFIAAERAKLVPKVKTVDVVVAKRNLKPGETVSGDTMAVRPIPQEFVASNAIRPDKFDGFIGAKLSHSLQAGESLVSGALAGADVATFSSKVKPGIRAMTVAVDEVNSVSGMLQPGDHIDLLLSVKPPATSAQGGVAQGSEVTAPLLQDILVLATGKQVRPGQGDDLANRAFSAITVEVSPEQAQKLVVAQRGGKLTAMLRNPGDHRELPKQSLDIYSLLGIRPPVMVPAAPQPVAALVQALPVQAAINSVAAPPPAATTQQHAVVQMLPGAEIIVGGRGPLAKPTSGVLGALPGAIPPNLPSVSQASSVVPTSLTPVIVDSEPSVAAPTVQMTPPPLPVSKPSVSAGSLSHSSLPQSLIEVR